jgi:Fe-S-cluster-containing hydrogenase component 2
MAENRIVTGNKDDLLVDVSRCLRMRFSESSCQRCLEICPHGAFKLDDGLSIHPQQCRGCLLCTSVCPAGALEQSSDFSVCLAQLSRMPEPVLGCVRTKECANGILTCLGGLSEEHLLKLCYTLSGKLTLNLTACGDCPNIAMTSQLRQRLNDLSEAGLLDGGCKPVIAESAQDIHYRGEAIDRRRFFKSFRNSLFEGAAFMLSSANEQTELRTKYAEKRLPVRRELLRNTRSKLSQDLLGRIGEHFDSYVTFDNTCTKCHGCVAICPTSALQTGTADDLPMFDQQHCTGCGLCIEFCLDGALSIHPVKSRTQS